MNVYRMLPFRIWYHLADIVDNIMWGFDSAWWRDTEGNWHGANYGEKGRIPFLRTIRGLRGKASSEW